MYEDTFNIDDTGIASIHEGRVAFDTRDVHHVKIFEKKFLGLNYFEVEVGVGNRLFKVVTANEARAIEISDTLMRLTAKS